jgi:hypothetical protein
MCLFQFFCSKNLNFNLSPKIDVKDSQDKSEQETNFSNIEIMIY